VLERHRGCGQFVVSPQGPAPHRRLILFGCRPLQTRKKSTRRHEPASAFRSHSLHRCQLAAPPARASLDAAVKRVLDIASSSMAGGRALEAQLAAYCGAKHVIGCASAPMRF